MSAAFRRFILGIVATILFASLIAFAWTSTLSVLRNQDTVKGWLEKSSFYDNTAGIILEQFAKDAEQPGLAAITDNNEVQQIAHDAFGADFLRDTTETVIASIYAWLEGKVDIPDFQINIRQAGEKLAMGLGDFARRRATNLPVCTQVQLTEIGNQFDALSAPCVPSGITPDQAGAQVTEQLRASFGDPTLANIGAENVDVDGQGKATWPAEIPKAYQRSRQAPFMIALLVLVSATGIILIGSEKRKGITRVALIMLASGIVVGLSALLLGRGPAWLRNASNKIEGSQLWNDTVLKLAETAGQDLSRRLWWFATAYVIIAVITIVLAILIARRRAVSKPKTEPLDPVPPIDDSPRASLVSKSQQTLEQKPTIKRPKQPPKIQL